MYAFLLLLLVPTIAAVPFDANGENEGLLASMILAKEEPVFFPQPILYDSLFLYVLRLNESKPCIANETAHHANVTDELSRKIIALCFARAGYADAALFANAGLFEAVHGIKALDDECTKALFGLKWKEDARLKGSLPFTKEDRKNVCSFLGDLKEFFCKVQEACAASQERLTIEFAQYYGGLHLVATNATKTDEDCPTASIPFAQKINPHAFTAGFDAHHESLLDPSVCS
ncbi:hypothetical protein M3Y99_00115600 [Aphelenchoides fujianensis]|nr:hypothetical protein M3Y99_00115600 [Aphelenchoides fujianensis]